MKNIVIDGVEFEPVQKCGEWWVFVVSEGWVILGRRAGSDDGLVNIANAYCVRKFGFGVGVASFVEKRSQLVLDRFPSNILVPESKLIMSFALPCDWSPPGE